MTDERLKEHAEFIDALMIHIPNPTEFAEYLILTERYRELIDALAEANRGYEIEKAVADKHFSDLTEARAEISDIAQRQAEERTEHAIILTARDKRIAELEAENKRLRRISDFRIEVV